MAKGSRRGLLNNYQSPLLILTLLLAFFSSYGQATYNPAQQPGMTFVINKPIGQSQGQPVDGRSWKADSINFLYRPFNGTSEVLTYFPVSIPKWRSGNFSIYVNIGGSLQSNGTFIGGQIYEYWWRNGVADSQLVQKNPISGVVTSFNGRSGAVVPQSGDYTFAQIGSTPTTIAGYGITDAVSLTGIQTLTNKSMSGLTNTFSNIPNSALTNSTIGLTLNSLGTTPTVTVTPAALGSSLTLSVPFANGSNTGFILNTDWTNHNNKVDSTGLAPTLDSVFDYHNGTKNFRYKIPAGTGAVLSVSNADATMVFSPTTGNVLGRVNTASTFAWTGLHSFTAAPSILSLTSNGGVLYTNGSGTIQQVTGGTTSQILQGGTTPSFFTPNATTVNTWLGYIPLSNALGSTHLFVGNGSNIATDVALTGDASITNTGVITNTGLLAKALPALGPGNLRYNGTAWVFDNTTAPTLNPYSYYGNATNTTTTGSSLDYVRNLKDFGGVNDSSADNTAAWNAMIASLPAGGGRVHIPAGKWRFDHTITITKNLIIEGDGSVLGSTFLGNRGTGTTIYGGSNDSSIFVVDSNATYHPTVGFQHINIINNKSGTPTAGSAIVFRGFCQRPWVYDCVIDRFFIDIDVQNAFYFSIYKNWIGGPISSAVRCNDSTRADTGDWGIYDNQIISGNFNGTPKGIEWHSGGGVKIHDNKFDAQSFTVSTQFTYAIWISNTLAATSDVQILNNSIEDFHYSGIFDSAANRLAHHIISNNQIAGVGSSRPGIDLYNCSYVIMVGNTVADWSGSSIGVRFTNCFGVEASNNVIVGYSTPWTQTGSHINRMEYSSAPSESLIANQHIDLHYLNTVEGGPRIQLWNDSVSTDFPETAIDFFNDGGLNAGVKGTSLEHYSSTTTYPYSGSFNIRQYDNSPIWLWTHGTNRGGIDSVGNWLIGSTTDLSDGAILQVKGKEYLGSADSVATATGGYVFRDAVTGLLKIGPGGSGGGGGTPAGPNGAVQVQNSGAFQGTANLTWNDGALHLAIGSRTSTISGNLTITDSTNANVLSVIQNKENGTLSQAGFLAVNSAGEYGGFLMTAPAYSNTTFANSFTAQGSRAIKFLSDVDVSSGGTNGIQLYTGGYSTTIPTLSLINGAISTPLMGSVTTDTTTYKPVVEDGSGNVRKMINWPLLGGSGAVSSVSNSDGTLTISPTTGAVVASLALGHANTWTGVQTQPAPIFTGTTSAGANDSILTINPSTGQVHWKFGSTNIVAANGVQPGQALDSIILGGVLNQNTTIDGGSSNFNLFLGNGLGNNLGTFQVNAKAFNIGISNGGSVTYTGNGFAVSSTASGDANITLGGGLNAMVITLQTITANRTVTLSSPNSGQTYEFDNINNSSFTWTFATTVGNIYGNAITLIPPGRTKVYYNGTSWVLVDNPTNNTITKDLTAQTTGVSLAVIPASTIGGTYQYRIGGYITIAAVSVNVVSMLAVYTDETNTSRTVNLFTPGSTSATMGTTGAFPLQDITIRAKAGSGITVQTSVTGGGSITYDAGAYIQQIN